jgi:MerR family transcriptional regulator/heat shock protein HspR
MTDRSRAVYAISVAAEMAAMQIQNLRVYERRGLVAPARTAGGTRLYSQDDVEVLQRIGSLLGQGLNLAGIAKVLDLEEQVRDLSERLGEAPDQT